MRYELSESEYQLLKTLAGRVEVSKWYSSVELASLVGKDRSFVEAVVRLLSEKNIVELKHERRRRLIVTEEGARYLREGFPEEKLVRLLAEKGGKLSLRDVEAVLGREAGIALANAARLGVVKIHKGEVELSTSLNEAARFTSPDRGVLERIVRGEAVNEKDAARLRRRRLVDTREEAITLVRFLVDPRDVIKSAIVEVGALTAEMIRTGMWKHVRLRRYNVAAEPPRLVGARVHPLAEFIEFLRDVMKEMGFVEVDYPPVELEFWNYDVLFQPQYHPARSPTDTFYLVEGYRVEQPSPSLVEKVAKVHEKGWQYKWDPRLSLRLILRSHTTSVSVRVLAERPQPPFRFFTIGRVYRVEKIDPRHLPEFHQLDGIASEDNMGFRDLLGILAEFFERIGIGEYKFRLAYFPFTEPSAEAYVRIGGEWMEVLGCGMFRPEVLEPLGIDYPVAAWGMGIERLAMAIYGFRDIRDLYGLDVHRLAERREVWKHYAGSTF